MDAVTVDLVAQHVIVGEPHIDHTPAAAGGTIPIHVLQGVTGAEWTDLCQKRLLTGLGIGSRRCLGALAAWRSPVLPAVPCSSRICLS
jgi:hypothetical protein